MFISSLRAGAKSSTPKDLEKVTYQYGMNTVINFNSYLKAQTNDEIHEKVTSLIGTLDKKRQSQ